MLVRSCALIPALAGAIAAASALAQPAAPPRPPDSGAVSTAPAMPDSAVPIFWRTKAERTNYRLTADYDETLRYCRQMEAGSRWIQYQSYGRSGQGRELPLLVVSSDRAFTPEAARATGKAILLIQNGIHSGEIEGKDASLALVRDLAVLRKRPDLLDHAILLVLPIFSVDAHERRGRYNRINQNGPEETGWRSSPVGLNLNRDYLKAETVEMRAMLANVFAKWRPHLLVDNHTTDGADHRYDLTYGIPFGPGVPAPVERWEREAIEGRIVPRLEALGHVVMPYTEFRDGGDPARGIFQTQYPPRFSHAYAALQNRPGLLVETHMLKPYAMRVRATYDLMVALLEEIQARPRELVDAVSASEAATAARAGAKNPADRDVVLYADTTSTTTPFTWKGVRTTWEMSAITGAPVRRYGTEPVDVEVPMQSELRPVLVVRQPPGYLVPQEWTVCRDLMDLHGVRYRRFAQAWSDSVDVTRIVRWSAGTLSEGHHPTRVEESVVERRLRAYRPGDLWVPLDQPAATVAMQLFEAQAPDGLTRWNTFDPVLEFKEYAEDYVMEPIARRMLAEDPALKREFEARLAGDSTFARSPRARVDFFFRRSPWTDAYQNQLPVARARVAPPERVLEPLRP